MSVVNRDKIGRILKGSQGTFLGQKHSKETIKKLRDSHKGYVMPESQKKNIRKARSKQIMKPMSKETKIKIGNAHRGMKRPKGTGKKISKALKGRKKPEGFGKKNK